MLLFFWYARKYMFGTSCLILSLLSGRTLVEAIDRVSASWLFGFASRWCPLKCTKYWGLFLFWVEGNWTMNMEVTILSSWENGWKWSDIAGVIHLRCKSNVLLILQLLRILASFSHHHQMMSFTFLVALLWPGDWDIWYKFLTQNLPSIFL